MSIRPILVFPDPLLREVAQPVLQVDDQVRELVEDMAETMYDAPGVGLAANQIGVLQRAFVIDIAGEDEPSDLRVFINPEILAREGQQTMSEGCLSFPGVSEEVKRATHVKVRALDLDGNSFELEAEGLMAVAIQHENDHLDGRLMIDKLSALKRRLVSRKVKRETHSKDHADPEDAKD
ncbi:peptide deformylase [Myxococcota bacterium]